MYKRILAALLATAAAAIAAVTVLAAATGTTTTAAAHAHAHAAAVTGAAVDANGQQTRIYYIAADEVDWDYAPQGRNMITGKPFGDTESTFVAPGPQRIGSVYRKALYREYTDASFRTLKPRDERSAHLGLLGPIIRAEVGDTIRVVFRNNASHPYSIHPHGVFYAKSSEGAGYDDGTAGADKADDAVPPHGQVVYTWKVPERAGPGPGDGSSVMWMYHSHVDEPGDTNGGLMGPIVITRAGQGRPDGSPQDVDREFVAMFSVMDENLSPYLQDNIARLSDAGGVDPESDAFHESNLMHSINGYVYGNGPTAAPLFHARRGERVRWYLMGMGTEVDLHTPHWHGMTATVMGMRTDVATLLPASMVTADMTPDNPGIWLFHCHVNDHIVAGMQSKIQIDP
jgi:FtsP/CotA-like multicopper oxidase with cupredoxin domain